MARVAQVVRVKMCDKISQNLRPQCSGPSGQIQKVGQDIREFVALVAKVVKSRKCEKICFMRAVISCKL